MNMEATFAEVRNLIQQDVGNRGLARDPHENLLTACPDDLFRACESIARTPAPALGVVTGFTIPTAAPPAAETDGSLGALFLARALVPLGIPVVLAIDPPYVPALEVGLRACGLLGRVPVRPLPEVGPGITHLVALERAGPTHTEESIRAAYPHDPGTVSLFLREVPPERRGHCHTMSGRDITAWTCPAHEFFEAPAAGLTTIGIADGGNEVGMGKIPWHVVRKNIPGGGRIACRVRTDHLIVAGVSNWGAYALAVGVALLLGKSLDPGLFDLGAEEALLRVLVEEGGLVDGISGRPMAVVDGLSFGQYAVPLDALGRLAL
jgi:hypothetical protein